MNPSHTMNRELLKSRRIRGASFSAYFEGRLVVNIRGGAADLRALRPWSSDTLSALFSASKALAGLSVALLAQRFCLQLLYFFL